MEFWEAAAPWLFGLAGLVTISMLQAAVAPQAVLRTYFGEQTDSPGLLAIVRNWGFGIAACGGLLVAAAFVPDLRVAAAVFAIVNSIIGTVIKIVAFPLYILTLGLISFLVNGLLLMITAWFTQWWGWGLQVEDLWHGILAAIVISLINWVFGIILRPQSNDRRRSR